MCSYALFGPDRRDRPQKLIFKTLEIKTSWWYQTLWREWSDVRSIRTRLDCELSETYLCETSAISVCPHGSPPWVFGCELRWTSQQDGAQRIHLEKQPRRLLHALLFPPSHQFLVTDSQRRRKEGAGGETSGAHNPPPPLFDSCSSLPAVFLSSSLSRFLKDSKYEEYPTQDTFHSLV